MKTTVEIPDALFREVKRYAADHNLKFKDVVETGLRQAIGQIGPKKKPFKLKRRPFKGNGMVKNFTWEEIRDIIYEGHGA